MLKNQTLMMAAAALALSACSKAPAPAAAETAAPAVEAAPVAAGIEGCAKAVLAQGPGELLQATLKSESAGKVWEFEVKQADGKLLDIECSDTAGTIVETETRVASAADPAFAAKAKVDEATATKTATDKVPGTIERVEYEVEPDGKVSYEFDIKGASGDVRVEVDAETGAIVEESPELLEIGNV